MSIALVVRSEQKKKVCLLRIASNLRKCTYILDDTDAMLQVNLPHEVIYVGDFGVYESCALCENIMLCIFKRIYPNMQT